MRHRRCRASKPCTKPCSCLLGPARLRQPCARSAPRPSSRAAERSARRPAGELGAHGARPAGRLAAELVADHRRQGGRVRLCAPVADGPGGGVTALADSRAAAGAHQQQLGSPRLRSLHPTLPPTALAPAQMAARVKAARAAAAAAGVDAGSRFVGVKVCGRMGTAFWGGGPWSGGWLRSGLWVGAAGRCQRRHAPMGSSAGWPRVGGAPSVLAE